MPYVTGKRGKVHSTLWALAACLWLLSPVWAQTQSQVQNQAQNQARVSASLSSAEIAFEDSVDLEVVAQGTNGELDTTELETLFDIVRRSQGEQTVIAPWVQQQVQVTLRIFHRIRIDDYAVTPPSADGISLLPIDDVVSRVERDGIEYRVIERRFMLFPQQSQLCSPHWCLQTLRACVLSCRRNGASLGVQTLLCWMFNLGQMM